MAKIVQRRRGTTTEHNDFPGTAGEITVDLTDKTIRVHDGDNTPFAAGAPTGYPLARSDMSNVSDTVGITQLKLSNGNPTTGQILQADGSGNILFVDPAVVDVSGSVVGGDISGTIGNAQIVANTIGNTELINSSVTNDKIVDGTIQQSKLANSSVGGDQIIISSVTADKIVDSSITTDKLQTNSVSTIKIIDLNVTTSKIADTNVTAIKLAPDCITTIKIVDLNVTDAKINTVSASKLTGALPAIDASALTGLPYDISFIAGFDTATSPIDIVVQKYGSMVIARNGVFDGEVGHIQNVCTGSDVIVDVKVDGVSIYSTPPRFPAGSQTMTVGVLSAGANALHVPGSVMEFEVTQIGSSTAGSGLRFMLKCKV